MWVRVSGEWCVGGEGEWCVGEGEWCEWCVGEG